MPKIFPRNEIAPQMYENVFAILSGSGPSVVFDEMSEVCINNE